MKNIKVSFKMIILISVSILISVALGLFAIVKLSDVGDKNSKQLESELRGNYDEMIKQQVENAISMLDGLNKKVQSGELTLDQAKVLGSDLLRDLRYGEDGYFWADQTDGTNVVLLGSATEGTNRMQAVDDNGYHMVQDIIKRGMDGGGYCDYVFAKKGETKSLPKRSYSKLYEPFGWVVGTGNYTDDIDTLLAKTDDKNNNTIQSSINFILLIGFLGLALNTIIGIIISRNIKNSLSKAKTKLDLLSTGDFTVKFDNKDLAQKDEFGDLERAMKHLSISLNTLLKDIIERSNNLKESVALLMESNDKLNVDMESVSATAEELSAGMEETAASSEEISNMTNDMENVSRNIAEKAQAGALKVEEIHRKATKAQEDTTANREKTNSIKEKLSVEVTTAINNAKVVEEISVLANAILGITDQTNLLALNASIEAARAGEAGKGFAVVADEIRNLAEQSKDSVDNIQKVTRDVMTAVENLSTGASQLLAYVSKDVTEDLDNMLEVANEYNLDAKYINDMVLDFSAISQELLASTESVSNSIDGIRTATNEGAIGISDIASQNTSMVEVSNKILEITENVQQVARSLNEETVKFKIDTVETVLQ